MFNFHKKSKIITPFDSKLIKDYNKSRKEGDKRVFCQAPFVSLQFTISGKVLPCCFNRAYVYGIYPETTLHDIWFGIKIKKLRKQVSDYNLSSGCFFCEHDLLKRNFGIIQSKIYDYFPINTQNGYPSVMEFALENTCNLKCLMCSGENSSTYRTEIEKGAPYPKPYDKNFIQQLEEFIPHLKRAVFAGGEPFLINIYYDIWEKMIELNPNIEIVICTNGTVLNQKIKDILNKGVFHFAISIDSYQKEVFESIRVNAKFEDVINNFNYFYEYSKKHNRWITVNVCPLQQNWQEIPDIIRKMNEMQVSIFLNNVYFPHYCTLRSLKSEEIENIINSYSSERFTISKTDSISKQNIELFNNFINTLMSWKKESDLSDTEDPIHNLEQMKIKFIHKIEKIINNRSNLNEQEKTERIKKNTETCMQVFDNFTGKDDVLYRALFNLTKMSTDMLYAELEISDIERLTGRFVQSSIDI